MRRRRDRLGQRRRASRSRASGTVCETTDAADDLLAQICDKGVLTVSTDPAYPPQSKYLPKEDKYVGFDIDVATEIANRLGVEIAWETPSWDVITAGSWNGRWDMSVGSMTPTNDRQEVLDFTEPYYYTPAVVVVHADNTSVSDLTTDLDGKNVGVCAAAPTSSSSTKTLDIKGFTFDFVIDDATIKGYDTDTTALQDLALGDGTRLDAAITSLDHGAGLHRRGQPGEDRRRPAVLRAARASPSTRAPTSTRPAWSRRPTRSSPTCTRTAP